MKTLNKKYFLLLAGILFVSSASLDPLFHEFSIDSSHEIQCQFCENEIDDVIKSKVLLEKIALLNNYKVEIANNFISRELKNFFSRAPPKI